MPISIIVLTYNSENYIINLLDSIYEVLEKEIKNNEVEIVVFDNASTDRTLEIVREYSKEIIIKESKINLGYGNGINEASKISKGELLCIINPDARLVKLHTQKIIDLFAIDEKIAIAGLTIQSFDGTAEKNAGKFFNKITFLLYALGLEYFAQIRFAPKKLSKVDFVSGGFIVLRGEFFKKIGGYDKDYFMYVEDMDLCLRAKKMGYKTVFAPFGTIEHKGQGSSNVGFAIVNIYKGLIMFYKKHFPSELNYIRSLLVMKAQLIIFLASFFGKKSMLTTYKKALSAIQ